MDYHLAETVAIERLTDKGMRYRCHIARCECGWEGPERDTRIAAESDAAAHDITENPA